VTSEILPSLLILSSAGRFTAAIAVPHHKLKSPSLLPYAKTKDCSTPLYTPQYTICIRHCSAVLKVLSSICCAMKKQIGIGGVEKICKSQAMAIWGWIDLPRVPYHQICKYAGSGVCIQ
jgi:hypothetical protein